MMDFLDKFEKRMEWIGVVDSIVNRRGKNTKVEGIFQDNEMTNIIVSVLLFIMEKTLEENNECDMQHIEEFLEELIRRYYDLDLNKLEIKELAGYIVKDILQCNGERRTYGVVNYTTGVREDIPIRLIADKIVTYKDGRRLNYMLTNQGYDFLFRTREVDEEIQLTIEQLKLKEYVKRKKFSSAVRQSVELISYVRQKKKEVENFILSIRQNIDKVDIDRYEQLLNGTYAMLQDEYDTMSDIQRMIEQAGVRINEELDTSKQLEDKLAKAINEIQEIHHNLGVAISEQRNLIINRHNLGNLYMDTIKRSFEYSFVRRFNIEESILEPLEKFSLVLDDCVGLLKPLFLPQISKSLSIEQIYHQQLIFKETEMEETYLVNAEEYFDELEKNRIEQISIKHLRIVELLFFEIIKCGQISLSSVINRIKADNPREYTELCKERGLFSIAFKLFDLEDIHLKEFYKSHSKIMMGNSEVFNLERCLIELENKIEGLKDVTTMSITKTADEIVEVLEYQDNNMTIREEIRMSDLVFKVVQ